MVSGGFYFENVLMRHQAFLIGRETGNFWKRNKTILALIMYKLQLLFYLFSFCNFCNIFAVSGSVNLVATAYNVNFYKRKYHSCFLLWNWNWITSNTSAHLVVNTSLQTPNMSQPVTIATTAVVPPEEVLYKVNKVVYLYCLKLSFVSLPVAKLS